MWRIILIYYPSETVDISITISQDKKDRYKMDKIIKPGTDAYWVEETARKNWNSSIENHQKFLAARLPLYNSYATNN